MICTGCMKNICGMVIAGLPLSFASLAGLSIASEYIGFGVQEGLKVPRKQHKKASRWTAAVIMPVIVRGQNITLIIYGVTTSSTERLENGRKVRMLVVIDEFTRECLALDVAKHFKGEDVVEVLRYLFAVRGCPDYIRSDNGPEFVSKAVVKWLDMSGVDTLYVAPGSPWENGYVESFNSKLRDEFLNRELFLHIDELRYVADRWRMDYNHHRPHSSLGYLAPAEFAAECLEQGSATLGLPQDKDKCSDVLS